jgi:hypothetical protein
MIRSAIIPVLVAWSFLDGALSPAEAGLPPIVFVSRALGEAPTPFERPAAIERAARGSLAVLEPGGSLRALVSAIPGANSGLPEDVMDPDVSYDGRRVLFAGYSRADSAWRIFEVNADGNALRQITRSDRKMDLSRYGPLAAVFESYDDVDPCYLPGGRICFVSTRYPQVAPDGRMRSTNLYVMNADGSGLHRITTERFGADSPTVEPSTGQIVYSRWWRSGRTSADPSGRAPAPVPPGSPGYGHAPVQPSPDTTAGVIDDPSFPGVNSWFLASINPDGTDVAMYSGFRLDRTLTQAHRPSFLAGGQAVALFIPQTPFYGYPRGDGLRMLTAGPSRPRPLGGPQTFDTDPIDGAPSTPYIYSSAASLPDGRLLVTAADRSTLDYGIYIQRGAELPVLFKDLPGTAELDAVPLVARPEPPVIPDRVSGVMVEEAPQTVEEAFLRGGSFTFLCENIHSNAPVDVAMVGAPPIGQKLRIDFFMNPQRQSAAAADLPILIRSLDIPPDGRIETELPAGVPLFEVLRGPDGKILVGNDGQIFHVGGMNFGRAGLVNRCVGCHSGHSRMEVPEDPAWTNVAPSAAVSSSGDRTAPADEPRSFRASNAVDRQTGDPSTEWAATEGPEADLTLRWTSRVRASQVIVHGAASADGRFGARNQVIHGLKLELSLGALTVASIDHDQDILPDGSTIDVDPTIEFDAIRIAIVADAVSGEYEGMNGPALAEVEVIGKATSEPDAVFVRGDADCSGVIELTDVIAILGHSLEGDPLCCAAAADANGDGAIDISDPIAILGFLFLGAEKPAQPVTACGGAVE